MSRLKITEDELNKEVSSDLLPVEQDGIVNGLPTKVKIRYLAEVTSSKEKVSKSSGAEMLEVIYSIWHPATKERLNITDYYAYVEKARYKLKALVANLGIKASTLDEDDFLGRWVVVTIKHESFTSTKVDENTGTYPTFINNKISAVLRNATPEEVMLQKQDMADAPPSGGSVPDAEMPDWAK